MSARPSREFGLCALSVVSLLLVGCSAKQPSKASGSDWAQGIAAALPQTPEGSSTEPVPNPAEEAARHILWQAQVGLRARSYAKAHDDFVTASNHEHLLTQDEQQAIRRGICLTERRLGEPTYPLEKQLESCLKSPNLKKTIAAIEAQLQQKCVEKIAEAINNGDAVAGRADLEEYYHLAGADMASVSLLEKQTQELEQRIAQQKAQQRLAEVTRLNELIGAKLGAQAINDITESCTSENDKSTIAQRIIAADPAAAATVLGQNPFATQRDQERAKVKASTQWLFLRLVVIWENERSCLREELKERGITPPDSESVIQCVDTRASVMWKRLNDTSENGKETRPVSNESWCDEVNN